ncbi:MAG TPA: protein phosphatase 2C domain-containing protein, partial [Polyangiales bacterium]|nr:protein phosphatase 2C domain-containing protein [Polyangiales bacterium]
GAPEERDALARRLVSAVEEAGRRIFDSAQKERSRRGMGTTATAAVLIDKVLFLAEVGDSRAYLLRAGQLKQLTKDQSLVNQLIEAGHLTEAEAEAFEHSNIILQALGTSETVQVDLTFVELRRGDRLMLCSDGLSGLVHGDTLRDTLAGVDDPSECTAALVRFAEAGGGHDNITVVVIDFDGDTLELPRETDSFGYLQYPLVPAASAASTFSEEEVTEATKPLSMGGSYETVPSYHPPAGPGVDTSPWLWVSAGLAALLVGTWLLAVGGSAGSAVSSLEEVATDDSNVAPAEPTQAPAAAAAEPTAAAEVKGVPVNVHSDVEDAVLLVNGESHGPLATGQGQSLELPPGAYRFEAQSKGNTAAVEVVTVRADAAPLDVFLRLPAGANGPAKTGQPTPPKAAEAPSQPAQEAQPAASAQPAQPAQPTTDQPKAPLSEPAKTQAPATE